MWDLWQRLKTASCRTSSRSVRYRRLHLFVRSAVITRGGGDGMQGLTSDVRWAAARRYRQGGSPHVSRRDRRCRQWLHGRPTESMSQKVRRSLWDSGLEGNASVTSNVSACAPVITAARKHSWGEKRPSLIINLAAPTELAGGKLNFEALLPNKVCCTLPCEKVRIHVGPTGL